MFANKEVLCGERSKKIKFFLEKSYLSDTFVMSFVNH